MDRQIDTAEREEINCLMFFLPVVQCHPFLSHDDPFVVHSLTSTDVFFFIFLRLHIVNKCQLYLL
ncbi:hypothetical protein B0T13DRAFT_473731 [Neurospora crassa]|nr:hypothetical protein B0T13DRAFT_473731 [Neurospora crassa]